MFLLPWSFSKKTTITTRSGLFFVGVFTMQCLLILQRVSSSSSSSRTIAASQKNYPRLTAAFSTISQQHRRHQQEQCLDYYKSSIVNVGQPLFGSSFYHSPQNSGTCSGGSLRFDWNTRRGRTISSSSLASAAAAASADETSNNNDFFADQPGFAEIGIQSQVLLDRLAAMSLQHPTRIQASSYEAVKKGGAVTIGSETGSGKTLAYLLPILDDILQQKAQEAEASADGDDGQPLLPTYDFARAVILVPNKELVQQVLRMAIPLCGGTKHSLIWGGGGLPEVRDSLSNDEDDNLDPKTVVRLAVLPGGLAEPTDFKPFRDSIALGGRDPPVDIVISTPAAMGPLALKPKHIDLFADIQTLVIDEADMLLDGGYIRALENVLMGFRRADKLDSSGNFGVKKTQHIFCAATLPDMGLRSVDAYLQRKFPYAERIAMAGMHNARHYGLKEPTIWIEEEYKKERMEKLVELLQTPASTDTGGESDDGGGLLHEKVMVFLNSVDDVNGATGALERAGLRAVPYHAKLSLEERSSNLDKFRLYSKDSSSRDGTVPILVCTDLASRGLDVPGVDAVVQLQFAGNVVAHLHRMGRCGRAGQRTGRGIVFYNSQERELVDVVRDAETQQERMVLQQDVDDLDEENEVKKQGKVQDAFSRKRGFTKKRKKLRRETNNP